MDDIDYKSYGLEPIANKPSENIPEDKSIDYGSYGLTPVNANTNVIPDVTVKGKKIDNNVLKRIPGALSTIGGDIKDVAASLPKKIIQGIGNIPKDIDYLKETVPQAYELIKNNPKLAAKYGLAGGVEFGGKVSRIPENLVDYLSHIGMIKPETSARFARSFSEGDVKNAMDKFVGESQPGGELIRGATRNADMVYGGSKLAQLLNPMKYTKGSIARDVIRQEERQMGMHTNAYNNLWDQARNVGINDVHYNPASININAIRNFPNHDYWASVETFLNDPTLNNAHIAQSDLGKMIRQIRRNPTIVPPSEVRNIRIAAENARDHIRDRMFRDQNGRINRRLSTRYGVITNSYRNNVIPYTTNKALQSYKNQDITLQQLIPGLEKGRFARMKGNAHPEISRRKLIKPILKTLGAGEALHLLGWDKPIIDKLLNKGD